MSHIHTRMLALGGMFLTAAAAIHAASLSKSASTKYDPYLEFNETFSTNNPNAELIAIRAVEDGAGLGLAQMVGIPDGMGAYDNGDGTFTILLNHEPGSTIGAVRAHGSRGALVSKWTVNKSDYRVLAIEDLIRRVSMWNADDNAYAAPGTYAFTRFCSANVPPVSAFFNAATGKGTTARSILNGEEGGEYRGWMHVATGPDAGTSFELAHLGHVNYENAVPSPFPQDKTVVISTDDTGNGLVTVYVGEKRAEGNTPEKAGLVGGVLYSVQVRDANDAVVISEQTADNGSQPVSGPKGTESRFSLIEIPVADVLAARSASNMVSNVGKSNMTGFARPEDGAWDPRPAFKNDFYFVCTASMSTRSRLYRMRFDDITRPELGGAITAILDGTEGHRMMDNITVSSKGKMLGVEDPGGNNRYAKTWQLDLATDEFVEVLQSKPSLFAPAASYFNNDEEASGIVDVSEILGPGKYLINVQVHTSAGTNNTARANLLADGGDTATAIENGQMLVLSIPEGSPAVAGAEAAAAAEITRGAVTYNRSRTEATQVFTLKNTTGAAIAGPFKVAFVGLPVGTTLKSPSGTVTVNGQSVPYLLLSGSELAANSAVNVTVKFATTAASATAADLVFVP